MSIVEHLLDFSNIGKNRLCLKWVSASEGMLFAEYVTGFSGDIEKAGPFNPEMFHEQLNALERVLSTPRLRWLIGEELALTEQGNVYDTRLDKSEYRQFLLDAAEKEYQRALILESIMNEPRSIREIAFSTGLPVYTVSIRMGELERIHQAELKDYRGTTPRFIGRAAVY